MITGREQSRVQRGVWYAFVRVVGFICIPIYNVLFKGRDRELSDKNTRSLATDIETSFGGLLDIYGGKILPPVVNSVPNGFDYGIVTIKFDNINIQIVRGRGELDVYLASNSEPTRWWSLPSAWIVIISLEQSYYSLDCSSLDQFAQFLIIHWDSLVAAFSAQNYPETKEKLLLLSKLPFREQKRLSRLNHKMQLEYMENLIDEDK